jgi:signal transduction histidine kinase
MRRPSLLVQFSSLSLVLFILIGLALGRALTDEFEEQALQQQTDAAAALLPPAVAAYIDHRILRETASNEQDYRAIENAFSFLGGAGLVRVKIWNPEGVIVYSDERTLVGQTFPISGELARALDGLKVSHISPLNKAENAEEQGFGELMEVYTPLYLPNENEPSGAFEGYFEIDELRGHIEDTNTFLWLNIGWGFLFLYISLFAIVSGASSRLIRQSQENALLLADTERKAARLQTVNELARSINRSSLDLDDVFQTAMRGVDRVVPHSGASLSLIDERTGSTRRRILSHAPEDHEITLADVDLDTERSLLGDEEVVLCPDLRSPEYAGHSAHRAQHLALEQRGVRSFLAVGIALGERRMGVLLVVSNRVDAFDNDDAAILKGVADQLAVAIENTRLIKETAETTALRETNRLKDEFVSMVSHELRTPLASIKGYSHTLKADDVQWDDETRREFLNIISEESDKLTDLVENLLEMSRIGAGRLPITPEPILLSRFCQGVVDRIAKHYPEIEFKCELSDPLPVVEADPRRLEQVLVNLLQNAAKYSGSERVTVRGCFDGGSDVVLSVEDEGKGIAQEHLPQLFDKFYRIEDGSNGKGAGSGLGLAIAKALIEAQGGRIWVESKQGKGTTFYFTLPPVVLHGEGGNNQPLPAASATSADKA